MSLFKEYQKYTKRFNEAKTRHQRLAALKVLKAISLSNIMKRLEIAREESITSDYACVRENALKRIQTYKGMIHRVKLKQNSINQKLKQEFAM